MVNGRPQPKNFKCVSGYVVQVRIFFFCTIYPIKSGIVGLLMKRLVACVIGCDNTKCNIEWDTIMLRPDQATSMSNVLVTELDSLPSCSFHLVCCMSPFVIFSHSPTVVG